MKRKIAIVEDDFLLALVIRKYLEKEGFECFTFSNAEDFLKFHMYNNDLELIILDVKINGTMDGVELFEKLAIVTTTPVLFTTGNSDIKDDARLISDQVKGILIKPIYMENVGEIISQLN